MKATSGTANSLIIGSKNRMRSTTRGFVISIGFKINGLRSPRFSEPRRNREIKLKMKKSKETDYSMKKTTGIIRTDSRRLVVENGKMPLLSTKARRGRQE